MHPSISGCQTNATDQVTPLSGVLAARARSWVGAPQALSESIFAAVGLADISHRIDAAPLLSVRPLAQHGGTLRTDEDHKASKVDIQAIRPFSRKQVRGQILTSSW